MNKAELLADITSKVLKIVDTIEEPDERKNAVNVKSYLTSVMEQSGDTARGRNIGWYTIDEGLPTEEAFYRDMVVSKNVAEAQIRTYLKSLVPSSFIRFTLESVNEEQKSAYASAVKDNNDGTCTEVRLFIYKNKDVPITHRQIK